MKNTLQKLTLLMIGFLAISCGSADQASVDYSKGEEQTQSIMPAEDESSEPAKSSDSKGSSTSTDTSGHHFSTTWSYDEEYHWHECTDAGCREVRDYGAHTLGDWTKVDPSTLTGADKYAYVNPEVKKCSGCTYYQIRGTNTLPELRFTFSKADPDADFATKATKSDLSRPEVGGTYSLSNCPEQFKFSNVAGTMKVRGNQTAGWSKKGFRIKFGKAANVLGLNGGKTFKKWILLADAKDTCLIRTALGLYISKAVIGEGSNVWVSEFTPVTVYLNDEYWGFYYLCEQKEVKDGRIKLAEPDEGYTGVDIGYCFELDHYADSAGSNDEASEVKKGADGDPTFRMRYLPEIKQGSPSGPLATGQVYTYTMLSDITDGPTNVHVEADYSKLGASSSGGGGWGGGWGGAGGGGNSAGRPADDATKTSNSNQLSFIRDRMELLYQILYYAAIGVKGSDNKYTPVAKEINASGELVDSSKSIEEVMRQYFDIDSWVEGSIIHAFSIAPDLGYSSFYMSYDNTPSGDKKLRFDCPWDFDSNFGNRRDFYVDAKTDTYVENTYNMWLYLLYKIPFFVNAIKTKWNALREAQVFEGMFRMMRQSFANYDGEIQRNHYKWPQNDAAHVPPNNFDEIRSPYKEPSQYKEAEAETIKWCSNRVNFLESKWGTGRPSVNTNA